MTLCGARGRHQQGQPRWGGRLPVDAACPPSCGCFRVIREGSLLGQRTLMALEQTLKKDWYSILGADPSANMSDLKQKYQKLILLYHPDKQSADVPAGTMEECMQKFIEIDQAWKILGNEETKKKYDLQRHEDELRNVGPVDAQVRLEEMFWNQGDESFFLSCRCGGKYTVSKDEAQEATLISCDACSLIVELLQQS
nr:putative DnaJ-like protein [Mus musculus]